MRQSRRWQNLPTSVVASFVLAAFTIQAAGQKDERQVCLAQGEAIYSPGEDHVKAPKLRIERGPLEKPLKSSSQAVLEVLINSAGTICEVRALKAPDRESAKQLAEYVADNFRFTPATRRGRAVPVRFKVVFNAQGRVHTE